VFVRGFPKISEICHNFKEFFTIFTLQTLSCIQFVRKFTQRINTNILYKEFCICNDAIVLVLSVLCVSTYVIQAGMNVILQFRTDKESTHLVTVAKSHS